MTSNYAGFKEQRSFTRFPASNDSAIMLSSANIISYSVLNVSKVGLAFSYNGSIETVLSIPNTTITLLSNDLGTTELPVEVVSDTELTTKDLPMSQKEAAMTRPYLRKCVVKFLPMSEEQENIVDNYLYHCSLHQEM